MWCLLRENPNEIENSEWPRLSYFRINLDNYLDMKNIDEFSDHSTSLTKVPRGRWIIDASYDGGLFRGRSNFEG